MNKRAKKIREDSKIEELAPAKRREKKLNEENVTLLMSEGSFTPL
jgi:hypothetical protein